MSKLWLVDIENWKFLVWRSAIWANREHVWDMTRLAEMAEHHTTSNLGIVGCNPTWGKIFNFQFLLSTCHNLLLRFSYYAVIEEIAYTTSNWSNWAYSKFTILILSNICSEKDCIITERAFMSSSSMYTHFCKKLDLPKYTN